MAICLAIVYAATYICEQCGNEFDLRGEVEIGTECICPECGHKNKIDKIIHK